MSKVYCFGNTSNGELGLGGIEDEHILLPRKQKLLIDKKYKLRQLSSGRNHTLVLLRNDSIERSLVLSCGSNERLQLGRSGSWKKFEAIDGLNQHLVTRVCCGANHSLALTEAGQVFAWGCNIFGQLGIANKVDEAVGKPSLLKKLATEVVVQIACGGNHNLALTKTGSLYSWGSNAFGQLGNGMKGNCENSPIEIVSIRCVPIRQLCCGGSHSGVLSYTGTVYMWGKNEFGQLGLNDTQNRLIPTVQSTLRSQKISFIDCGEEHSAALTSDGGLFTWGAGMYGQLGHAKNVNEILPLRVFELMGNTVTQVSCGRCHTLASVGSNGKVYAFGLNGSGQLGIGTQISKFVPINVRGKWIDLGVKDLTVRDIAGSLMTIPKESLPDSPKQNISRKAKSPVNESFLNEPGDEMQNPENYEMSIDEIMENEEIDSEEMSADESAIIEEPDDKSRYVSIDVEPSFVCTANTVIPTRQESIEIDEYLSDPDSDEVEREQLVLTEVVASKGDQSFVLVSRLTDKPKPKDFRFDNPFDEIYKLENCIFDELKTSKDKTISYDTIDYVENVFSSISCWNASYINFSDNSDSALPSIDWNSALRGFHNIEEVESGRFHGAILHSILKIIPKLPNIYDEKSLDPEVLRIYLLLPLFHMFRTGVKSTDIMKNLIAGYSKAITRLSDYALEALNDWWSRINKQYFRKLIKIYKRSVEELLSIQDKENQRNIDQSNQNRNQNLQIDLQLHENLSLCLNLLSLLHKVNQKSGKISYKEFYIEGISDKFDVKQDYIHWLISRVQQSNRNPSQKTLYLCDYPFIFDPPAKTLILSTDSFIQQQNAAENSVYRMSIPFMMPIVVANPFLVLSVTRDTILQSTIEQLCNRDKNPSELKKPLKVNFEGEEAIDAGAGMKKEFFLLLMKEMLDQKFGMFIEYNETHSIWFNPGDVGEHEDLVMYNLIGIVCGLAIYNQVIIYLPFPLALYKKLLDEPLNIDDLNCLDPILTKNLKDILNSEYSVEEFNAIYGDLNFTITLQCYGSAVEFELEKGGKRKALNWENRCDYVRLYWNFILNESVKNQFHSFKSGFNKVLDVRILQLFHAEELMRLLTGEEVSDWVLLEKVTEYKEPFSADHPTIILFWKIFHSLSEEEKKKFLLFLTGSDRIPILGMKALKVTIQAMKVSEDHLPVAHTCFNILDLAESYSSEEKLKQKLLQSIEHTHGYALA